MADPADPFGQDLSIVHSFYLFLLETTLGHEVPVPPSIAHDPGVLQRFVLLLDLAVTPQMIRDGLKGPKQRESAEALLRFFAAKQHRRREDRDKADVIATALYRLHIPEKPGESTDEEDSQRIERFAEELRRIYKALPMPEPASEHLQLVREFQFLRAEVNDFRHFDELIDSAVIQKVRDLKETLDVSFLHPQVLATVGAYNAFFGERFDLLFKRAAKEVKTFAAKVQQDGGSIMSRVDGDVIVKHLADVDEGKILNEEYGRAQEDLRHISKLKKAVDNRRFGKSVAPTRSAPAPSSSSGIAGGTPPRMPLSDPVVPSTSVPRTPRTLGPTPFPSAPHRPANWLGPNEPPTYNEPRSSSSVADVEMEKLHAVQVKIRSFVRAADAHSAHLVPLPHGNTTLTTPEVDAFRAEFGNEKSFRADFAGILMQLAALDVRLMAELQEFEKTRYTAYNWKPHADALAHLLSVSRTIAESAMHLQATAQQRGLGDKVAALHESVEKVRVRARTAAEMLQTIGSGGE
jgi:hypothetical protein